MWNEIICCGGNNVLVVTHAVVLKVLYSIIRNFDLKDLWKPPFMKDTCLTIVEVNESGAQIIIEADTSHLESI